MLLKSLADAHEGAAKEAVTDAIKKDVLEALEISLETLFMIKQRIIKIKIVLINRIKIIIISHHKIINNSNNLIKMLMEVIEIM